MDVTQSQIDAAPGHLRIGVEMNRSAEFALRQLKLERVDVECTVLQLEPEGDVLDRHLLRLHGFRLEIHRRIHCPQTVELECERRQQKRGDRFLLGCRYLRWSLAGLISGFGNAGTNRDAKIAEIQ